MPIELDEFTGKRFGKYEVLCRLAAGGMAELFLGFLVAERELGRPVVMKRIHLEKRDDPTALQMLLEEAKVTARLSHPSIAQILDIDLDGDDLFLVMELVSGANLEELSSETFKRKQLLPVGFVVSAIRGAALGLKQAHLHVDSAGQARPIVHRDVTPRNLMVTFDGKTKVLDFGIARAVGASRLTAAGLVRGTAAYMSPEQVVDGKVDARSDIFSLGTVFHELLTGARLFSRGNPSRDMAAVYEGTIPRPSEIHSRVSKRLDAVVMKALDRSVSSRFATMAEFVAELDQATESIAWSAAQMGPTVTELFQSRRLQLQSVTRRIRTTDATEVGTILAPFVEEPTRVGKPSMNTQAPLPASGTTTQLSARQRHDEDRSEQLPPWRPVRNSIVALGLGSLLAVAAFFGIQHIHWRTSSGKVSVDSNYPAEIRVGDEVFWAPAEELSLPIGHHVAQVRRRGSENNWKKLEFDVFPQRLTRLNLKMDEP